ncbi:MAG: hypothetical protein U0744_19600 [Gemmataceae bacterium]
MPRVVDRILASRSANQLAEVVIVLAGKRGHGRRRTCCLDREQDQSERSTVTGWRTGGSVGNALPKLQNSPNQFLAMKPFLARSRYQQKPAIDEARKVSSPPIAATAIFRSALASIGDFGSSMPSVPSRRSKLGSEVCAVSCSTPRRTGHPKVAETLIVAS